MLRARRRVMELDEASELLGTDRAGIRALIACGELTAYELHGRTRVDVIDVEKTSRDQRAAGRGAVSGSV